jgi:hypothetical protein
MITETRELKTQVYYSLKQQPERGYFRYQRQMRATNGWPNDLQGGMAKSHNEISPSPQKILGQRLLSNYFHRINNTSRGLEADSLLVAAVEDVLKAKEVEPCVRLVNLRRLLLVGTKISPAFIANEVTKYFRRLDDGNAGIPGMPKEDIGEFLDPDRDQNSRYLRVRTISERLLADAVPVVQTIRRDLELAAKTIDATRLESYECVGRVGRHLDGSLRIIPSARAQPKRIVDVIMVKPDGSSSTVGKTDGKGGIEVAANASLAAGLPCFIRRAKDASKDRPDAGPIFNKN